MVTRREFERALERASSPGERVAIFGALLANDTGLRDRLVVVGGSAISVYTNGAYVSEDIDIVAPESRATPCLKRWGFVLRSEGPRRYWVRSDLGILVDLIDRKDYVGLADGTRLEQTEHGPVRIAALEDLIVRRLVFAKRDKSPALLDQAVLLWVRFGRDLDEEYLAYHVRYEGVADLYDEMKRRASRARSEASLR